jgi:hypothetical protein
MDTNKGKITNYRYFFCKELLYAFEDDYTYTVYFN